MSSFQTLENNDETTICDNPEGFSLKNVQGETIIILFTIFCLRGLMLNIFVENMGAYLPSISDQYNLKYVRGKFLT